jgi:hypothetical protein
MTEAHKSEDQHFNPPTDRPYRLMCNPAAVCNKWTLHVAGQQPFFFDDESDAKHVFFMVEAAFSLGRQRAFHELRALIGAAHG